jgi:hypothetical protein
MSSFSDLLDRAAGAASCDFLRAAGNSLITAGAISLGTGAGSGPSVVPFGLGAAAFLAANLACGDPWDPEEPGTNPIPPPENYVEPGSCLETNGCGLLPRDRNGAQFGPGTCKKMFGFGPAPDAPNGAPQFYYSYVDCKGDTVRNATAGRDRLPLSFEIEEGFECVDTPEPPPLLPNHNYEYTYEGPDCTVNVKYRGLAVSADGSGGPVWEISPGAETRNAGGIISQCNFNNIIYFGPRNPGGGGGGDGGGGGNGPFYGPAPERDDDEPYGPDDLIKLLRDVLVGAFGTAVADLTKQLLTPPYDGTIYRVTAACEVNENGEGVSKAVEIPIDEAQGLDAALFRLDAIAALLQPLKDFKQPICYATPGEGDARTICFRSTEKSPNGNDHLRKRFRYRSKSGADLGAVIDHWKDFTFNAGSVVVGHSGSALGTLKVWAADADEGKRVIQHAGAEAGIDPDQAGEWRIGSSDNARTGMPGTMKVDTRGGYWWITDRAGASKRPIVGLLNTSDT